MSRPALENLPEVPISTFKANPIAYAETGALVMVHNRPRMRVLPVVASDAPSVIEVKTRLRLLNELIDPAVADAEQRDLAAERDAERLGEAQ